jgi:hypothetical protein
MYLLQRGTSENLRLSREFFTQAISRADRLTHPLAMYMLGWLAEVGDKDLLFAEKYYCSAMQVEPMDPLTFLKLKRMASDSLTYVGEMTQKAERQELIRKKKDSNSETVTSMFAKVLSPQDMSFYGLSSSIKIADALSESKCANDLSYLRNRENLHSRVTRLAQLRFNKAENQISGWSCPHKFVSIDPFWLDRLSFSFASCDDWSHLLRQSKSYREKIAELNS